MADRTDTLLRPRGARRARRTRTKVLWIGVAAALAIALGVAIWWAWPSSSVKEARTVTAYGVEYTVNVDLEEHGGYVYLTVPVNSDTDDIRVEVEDANDTQLIREFLDSLDTLVPGEHVVSTSQMNLHFIVDGIDEE